MSEHTAILRWKRTSEDFTYQSYNRGHTWIFDGGSEIRASAAPGYLGDADCVDPEEAFVAALASCHMLTFLAVAARQKFVVDAYRDEAVGCMEKNSAGKMAITTVKLNPKITFSGEKTPTEAELQALHHAAHENCFIANSVLTKVEVS